MTAKIIRPSMLACFTAVNIFFLHKHVKMHYFVDEFGIDSPSGDVCFQWVINDRY